MLEEEGRHADVLGVPGPRRLASPVNDLVNLVQQSAQLSPLLRSEPGLGIGHPSRCPGLAQPAGELSQEPAIQKPDAASTDPAKGLVAHLVALLRSAAVTLAIPKGHRPNKTGRRKPAQVITRCGMRQAGDHPEDPQALRMGKCSKPEVDAIFQRNVWKLSQKTGKDERRPSPRSFACPFYLAAHVVSSERQSTLLFLLRFALIALIACSSPRSLLRRHEVTTAVTALDSSTKTPRFTLRPSADRSGRR